MQVGRAMAMSLGVVTLACLAGDGTGVGAPPPPPPPPPGDVSFATDIQPVFTASCALTNCHVGAGPTGAPGLTLSEGQALAATVNVPSSQVVRLLRIEPGNADSSYLILKLEGDQNMVGGLGATMPINANPLCQATIDLIRAWIDAGAEDN